MELIEVNQLHRKMRSYILQKEHLVAKQLERNGLQKGQLTISDKALAKIISAYTREAGVRNLERKLGEIARKAAREVYEGKKKTVRIPSRT